MITQATLLVTLVLLVNHIPMPPLPPAPRKRGHPKVYSDRLFLKALVIMIGNCSRIFIIKSVNVAQ